MRFLLKDLRMDQNIELFTSFFEKYVPRTLRDMVLLYIRVQGIRNGVMTERSYRKQFFANGCTAIEMTTASSLCAIVELWARSKIQKIGLLRQEHVNWDDFVATRHGALFHGKPTQATVLRPEGELKAFSMHA